MDPNLREARTSGQRKSVLGRMAAYWANRKTELSSKADCGAAAVEENIAEVSIWFELAFNAPALQATT